MSDETPSLFPEWDADRFDSENLETGELSLRQMIDQRRVPLRWGKLFERTPDPIDCTSLVQDDRIKGMLVGVALGDVLGHSTEWRYDPDSRHARFGTIVDHLAGTDTRPGRISDDTQMTFWTLEHLLSEGHFRFDDLAKRFVNQRNRIVGMGKNTAASLERHAQRFATGRPAIEACAGDPISSGRGNGGLMRFAPHVLPYLSRPSASLWSDSVLSVLITHGNAWALGSIAPMTSLLWSCLGRSTGRVPESSWWIDEYIRMAEDIEMSPLPYPLDTDPIPVWYKNFRGGLCDFLDGPVRRAFQKGIPLRDACSLKGFGSRADILQTIPAVLYTLMCHADDATCALIAAVNDTKDNDTIGAVVGAYVGAIHGKRVFRKKWIDGIHSVSLHCDSFIDVIDRNVILEFARSAQEKFCLDA